MKKNVFEFTSLYFCKQLVEDVWKKRYLWAKSLNNAYEEAHRSLNNSK